MASTPHQLAEDEALERLVAHLTDRGFTTSITARPDRDGTDGLTVDALLVIEGVTWAVDHTLLTWGSGAPPQAQRLVSELQGEIERRAREAGKFIRVLVSAQPNDADPDAVVSQVLADVNRALECGTRPSGIAHTVHVADMNAKAEGTCEILIAQGSDPRALGAVAAAENRPVIESKLQGQLHGPRESGFRTGLLIDQFHHDVVPTGTNWLISRRGIARIVEDAIGQTGLTLSAAWALDKDGAIALIYGAIGTTEKTR